MERQKNTETKFYGFNAIFSFAVFAAYMLFVVILLSAGGLDGEELRLGCMIAAIPAAILCLPFCMVNFVKYIRAKTAKLIFRQEVFLDRVYTKWGTAAFSAVIETEGDAKRKTAFSADSEFGQSSKKRVETNYVFSKSFWKIRMNKMRDYDGRKVEIAYNPKTKKAVVIGVVEEKRTGQGFNERRF